MPHRQDSLLGCLIGTAVGDSVGLVAEGLSPRAIARRYPGPWRQRFLGPWGMCSDDTEHTFLVAQALLRSRGDVRSFQRHLARGLRWWLASLPGGIGLATLRATVRLWLGWPPHRAGVWSAGNGPAMRSALLGVCFADEPALRLEHVRASARLTHTDPRAEVAARAVAEVAAAWTLQEEIGVDALRALAPEDREWLELMAVVEDHLVEEAHLVELCEALGLQEGVTGYAYHSVPCVLFAVLRYAEPREALEQLYARGGDTDTTGAMAGALLGARHGEAALPEDWVRGLRNGPLSTEVLREAGRHLATDGPPVRWAWPAVVPRNLLFIGVELAHVLRRLWRW